ncbi:hypothetical protein T11_18233 [Trichinella zimbabwensis]|uniref:Uncharacterized protein n=1 Tax=Trichinella zimbabwensis TaxID=268475 RepID=A0A0V1GYH3_9BILA|nr:hypothetical protein T11_18233 [Trichinella zimbabwensis]
MYAENFCGRACITRSDISRIPNAKSDPDDPSDGQRCRNRRLGYRGFGPCCDDSRAPNGWHENNGSRIMMDKKHGHLATKRAVKRTLLELFVGPCFRDYTSCHQLNKISITPYCFVVVFEQTSVDLERGQPLCLELPPKSTL